MAAKKIGKKSYLAPAERTDEISGGEYIGTSKVYLLHYSRCNY